MLSVTIREGRADAFSSIRPVNVPFCQWCHDLGRAICTFPETHGYMRSR